MPLIYTDSARVYCSTSTGHDKDLPTDFMHSSLKLHINTLKCNQINPPLYITPNLFTRLIKGRVTSKMKLSDKVKWTLKSTSSSMNCQKNVNFYVRKSILCQIFSQSCYSICWLFLTVHSQICRVLPTVRVTQIAVGEFIFNVGTQEENTTYGILLTNNYSRKDCLDLHFMNI